jgi:hypothetical protein
MHTPYNWEGAVGQGWRSLVEPLIELCKQADVPILQVKEKYGGLRFYVGAAPDEVHAAIEAAEEASLSTCEVCGNTGTLMGRGWFKTRCQDHKDI